MTVFLLACAALVVLSGVFFLRPGRRARVRAQAPANLDWYELRLRELRAEGQESLVEDAQLRLLEDTPANQEEPAVQGATRGFRGLYLLPAVTLLAALLYWQLGAAPDVLISRQLMELDADTPPQQLQELMSAIGQRAAARPENPGYLSLLARFHMGNGDFAAAAQAYAALLPLSPEDAQVLALAAQAQYLAAGRQLTIESRSLAERALELNPTERTALGLLGMAAFEAARYDSAIAYWQRLQVLEPPGSPGAQMLADVIAAAQSRLGVPEPAAGGEQAAGGVGITVVVASPDAGALRGDETVFVLARRVGAASRMPIAVQRFLAADLPLTLRLDDSNSMAGQKLSEAGAVQVFVQVSPEGRPGMDNATFSGASEPVTAAAEAVSVRIELQPVAG